MISHGYVVWLRHLFLISNRESSLKTTLKAKLQFIYHIVANQIPKQVKIMSFNVGGAEQRGTVVRNSEATLRS